MRVPLVALALVLAATGRAQARGSDADLDPLWDGELGASFSGELDRQTPPTADTPISHTAALTPQITGGYFLHSLVDETEGALALVPFYQHPGEVTLAVGNANAFTDSSGSGWSSTQRTLSLDAQIEGYPWHETGLFGTLGASFSGVTGDVHGDTQARYGIGVIHYFRPNLRGELTYLGSANQSTTVVNSLQIPAIQDIEGATNAGQARFMAVLLNDRLSSDTRVSVGQFSSLLSSSSANGASLPGDYTHGISFLGEETVTGYFGHQLSGSLTAGVAGSISTTEPDQKTLGVSSSTSIAPLGGASLQYFVIDPIALQLSYVVSAPRVRSVLAPGADIIDQVASLSFVARL